MNHLSETALEQYLLGGDDLAESVEQHILECDDCAAHVRAQIELEMQLAEVARAAKFCPGCNRVLEADRCDACGATVVAGGYRIEGVLVKTTHGRLYVAVDGNGKRVALKELAFVQAPTLESLAAFDRETKFLRALSHPCIPKFHASFIEGTGIHTRMYIAQDLVEGQSLLARLADHWFAEPEIIAIARHVLEILIYLQSLSPMVFHRDIKPANLIARADGSIALVDFGAARDVSETMGNTAVGTFGYMPMEQMAGIYDATTDLYALGATLLHLLTRREPLKLLEGTPAGVNVSPGLRAYLDKLCAPRRQDRFPDARAALAAIGDLRTPAPAKKNGLSRGAIVGITVACLASGIGAGAMLALSRGEDKPSLEAPSTVTAPLPPQQAERRATTPRPNPEIEIGRHGPEQLTAADLLPPGLVVTTKAMCELIERFPSGKWPAHCAQGITLALPEEIQRAVDEVPIGARGGLRAEIAGAQERRASHEGIAIGKIVIKGMPSAVPDARSMDGLHQSPDTTVYYAVPTAEPFEVALHGYPRTSITPALRPGEIKWLPDVTLDPLGSRGATVVGKADAIIRASILHANNRPSPRSFEARVTGAFELAGFTPGRYRITIIVEGVEEELIVELRAGERLDLDRKRQPRLAVDAPGDLQLTTKPPMRVVIDGKEVGTTPLRLRLAPGRHRVTFVSLDGGGAKLTDIVTIKSGETLRMIKDFSDELRADTGEVDLASKPRARVFLDGVDTGLTTPTRFKAPPGRHKITLVEGTSKWTFPVEVKAGETVRMIKDFSGP